MSEWLPIESAPKEGFVLLRGGRPDPRHYTSPPPPVVSAYAEDGWDDEDDDLEVTFWVMCVYDMGCTVLYLEPTHWMPLPSPPKEMK